MKTIKLNRSLKYPTIVEIASNYYLVSKKYFPETHTEKGEKRYIAINLNDGKWFDWGSEIPEFEPEIKVFKRGTKFEIEI